MTRTAQPWLSVSRTLILNSCESGSTDSKQQYMPEIRSINCPKKLEYSIIFNLNGVHAIITEESNSCKHVNAPMYDRNAINTFDGNHCFLLANDF